MRQIGFKNFRKFENFPSIELAPITVLVGENNAGKSTVVKGMLALSDFFNKLETDRLLFSGETSSKSLKKRKGAIVSNLKNQKFYFNTSYLAHIGTFKRALYNKANSNIITFNTSIDHEDITIEVYGDRNNEEIVNGFISKILIDYRMLGIHIGFDLLGDKATVVFNPINVSKDNLDFLPTNMRVKAQTFLKSIPHTFEINFDISNYYRKYVPDLLFLLKASVEIAFSATIELEKTIKHIGSEVLLDIKPIPNLSNETISFLRQFAQLMCPAYKGEGWMFILPDSDYIKKYIRIEYLYAHAVTQTVLYSAKDTNDYLSMTIHEFASKTKSNEDYRKKFITHWMEEFNIGKDYDIKSIGGEAHIVKIKNNDGEEVNLADKGMGSIQLMVLLFRLAIALPKMPTKSSSKNRLKLNMGDSRIIIIEEPEQNLHPMLQSKLANLFYELNTDYGFRFLIETHSEYLIRKTQVIVGEKFKNSNSDEFEKENPFKVYYFPQSGIPYDMEYTNKGGFKQKFGDGFFNEASRLNSSVIKNKLEE